MVARLACCIPVQIAVESVDYGRVKSIAQNWRPPVRRPATFVTYRKYIRYKAVTASLVKLQRAGRNLAAQKKSTGTST